MFSERRIMIRFEIIDENTKNLEEIKQLYFDAFPFEDLYIHWWEMSFHIFSILL